MTNGFCEEIRMEQRGDGGDEDSGAAGGGCGCVLPGTVSDASEIPLCGAGRLCEGRYGGQSSGFRGAAAWQSGLRSVSVSESDLRAGSAL